MDGSGAGVEVALALRGHDQDKEIVEKDYRVRCLSIVGEAPDAMEQLVEDFEHSYCRLSTESDLSVPWPGQWHAIVRNRLEALGPQGTFPFDVRGARAIVGAYRTPGGRGGAKDPRKRPSQPRD